METKFHLVDWVVFCTYSHILKEVQLQDGPISIFRALEFLSRDQVYRALVPEEVEILKRNHSRLVSAFGKSFVWILPYCTRQSGRNVVDSIPVIKGVLGSNETFTHEALHYPKQKGGAIRHLIVTPR